MKWNSCMWNATLCHTKSWKGEQKCIGNPKEKDFGDILSFHSRKLISGKKKKSTGGWPELHHSSIFLQPGLWCACSVLALLNCFESFASHKRLDIHYYLKKDPPKTGTITADSSGRNITLYYLYFHSLVWFVHYLVSLHHGTLSKQQHHSWPLTL